MNSDYCFQFFFWIPLSNQTYVSIHFLVRKINKQEQKKCRNSLLTYSELVIPNWLQLSSARSHEQLIAPDSKGQLITE